MSHDDAMRLIQHNEEVFEVKKDMVIGKFHLLWVFFPNCPNGDKIMVYRNHQGPTKPYTQIKPHFNQEGSPFARFEPTECGWIGAIRLAQVLMENL